MLESNLICALRRSVEGGLAFEAAGSEAGINQALTHTDSHSVGGIYGEPKMVALIFTCPKTGRPIESGIETERASLSDVQSVRIRVRCPHCWEEHDRRIRDAHLASMAYASFGEAVMY
jgi:hypothetical protein